MEISVKDYMVMQPNYPKVAESDKYYLQLAIKLGSLFSNSNLLTELTEDTQRNIVLATVGYFQDIVADCGIWRSFITIHNKFYNRPLPFYSIGESYCESELNQEDIRFLIWYVAECHAKEYGQLSPFNNEIDKLATIFFNELDKIYLNAPTPMEYVMAMDVELDNLGQAQNIFELSSWLFWNSYLMRHSTREAVNEASNEAQQIIAKHPNPKDAAPYLSDLNDRIMLSNPIGPLALTSGEWLKAIIDGILPENEISKTTAKPHKDYSMMLQTTTGNDIAFVDSYDNLEEFLCTSLNWGLKSSGHMPQYRKSDNFVLLATPQKGVIVVPNLASVIAHPSNHLYNASEAKRFGHSLITTRGKCPIELISYLLTNDLMPDISLPYDHKGTILKENSDFLLRLYQQRFYRTDI